MPLENGARLGPYEIVESIGAGGMGEVYRAHDPRIGRDVAIKILPAGVSEDPERLRRFEQEARAAGSLNHPNLLTIHDIGSEGGAPYLVTELLEGETVRERLGSDGSGSGSSDTARLSARRVTDWGTQIANGLAAAHEAGIVHRDLKPENIFITRDGRVKILDFGLAKLQGSFSGNEEDETVQRDTDPGTVMGTIAYMSPEQVRGHDLDHRSDIFSLGLILYELASGRRAFQRETKPETMTAILKEDPEDLGKIAHSIPPALVRIIDHCLEKHPEQRFQSARDLSFHLSDVTEVSGRSEIGAARRPITAREWWIAAAVGIVALIIGFLAGRATNRVEPVLPEDSSAATQLQTLTFSGRDLSPAVSPDGKLMAFASDRDGVSRIWIKQLAGGGELALTDGPDLSPRFSPDGSTLLFVRTIGNRSSIYKVPLIGGEPRKLVDDAVAAGWSPDGTSIVFIRLETGNDLLRSILLTASADGSDEKEISRIDGRYMWCPRWSPDGKWIALAEFTFSNLAHQPLLVRADGSGQKWLELPIDSDVQSGVEWVDENRLLVCAIPTGTTLVSGTGSLIMLHDLISDETRTLLYVSSPVQTLDVIGDGRIVFDTTPLRQNLRVISTSDGATRWLTRGTSVDRQPDYSPDGSEIIFSSNMSGNLDLWVISTEDGGLRRLTDDEANDYDPTFSSDGRNVYWSSERVTGNFEIWAANADGSGALQVSRDGVDAENPTPTPDDQWIVYNSYHPDKKGIWKIRPDGSDPTHLAKVDSQLPEVSPDGLYASFHAFGSNELKVIRLSDGEIFSLGTMRSPGTYTALAFGRSRWKPDSNVVVFVDEDEEGRVGLWEQPFVPGEDTRDQRRKLTGFDADRITESFGFAPDAETLTISGLEQINSIMISDPIPELAQK